MGATITIDKRTTQLQDWFEIHHQIQSAQFQSSPHNHLVIWKLFSQQNHHQINCLPLSIDNNPINSLFHDNQAYVVLAIRHLTNNLQNGSPSLKQIQNLTALLNGILESIEHKTYETPITKNQIGDYEYCIYTYLGKHSHNKIRILALNYAYQLKMSLDCGKKNSIFKISILGGGGFIKNKKLQKAPIAVFIANKEKPITTDIKQLAKFSKITLLNFFMPATPTTKKLAIFLYRPTLTVPQIKISENQNSPTQITSITNKGIKPPMLKLNLKPFEQVTYEQIEQQQSNGMLKYDIRATTRHELKMERFEKECNEIMQGIYLSGEYVAKNLQILQKYNITQIINCAGDYCENWFQNHEINYLTFFLKDSQTQNIQSLFYRVIQFIQNAIKNKHNVLIHCIQGISRSVTFVIAYIIFTYGYDYKKAESFVKQKRGIASPNNGFMVQLIQFHKRLYEEFKSLPLPRVFLVSSHCKETPHILTSRLLKNPLFDPKKYVGLDARGVYIIQTEQITYLWVGSKCEEGHLQKYWAFAQEYIKKLQRYQRAPVKIKAISQGSETSQFYQLWNITQTPPLYENQDYNRLFYEGQPSKPGLLRKYYQRQEQKSVANRLFIYPESDSGLGVFQMDDLNGFCILVNIQENKTRVYIWRGKKTNITEDQQQQFIDSILKKHYSDYPPQSIIISEQSMNQYSEGFLACFA